MAACFGNNIHHEHFWVSKRCVGLYHIITVYYIITQVSNLIIDNLDYGKSVVTCLYDNSHCAFLFHIAQLHDLISPFSSIFRVWSSMWRSIHTSHGSLSVWRSTSFLHRYMSWPTTYSTWLPCTSRPLSSSSSPTHSYSTRCPRSHARANVSKDQI